MDSAPSRNTFRIAVMGLLGGCVLALWLLVRPPGVPGETSGVINNGQPTASPGITPAGAGGGTGQPTLVPTGSAPATTATPGAGSVTPTPVATTAGATTAPTATPTEAPAGPISYTVQEGDTWFGIAEAYGVDASALVSFNGLTLDDFLQIDQTILIPQ